jgi:hypothetical protein
MGKFQNSGEDTGRNVSHLCGNYDNNQLNDKLTPGSNNIFETV